MPVAVTVSPDSGFRGTVITVTATATPAAGTATNAMINLSALGLSTAATLVQSDVANVFTNSFTVPTNAAVGLHNLIVTVIDTEPLVGSGVHQLLCACPASDKRDHRDRYHQYNASMRTPKPPSILPRPTTPPTPRQAYFPMTYAWYKGGMLVSTNPMGPDYTFLTTPGDNGMSIYAIASVADTNY